MDRKHEALRRELAVMGYTEYLSVDSTPLVDRLLSDIKRYSEENRDAKAALQSAEHERHKKEALALAYQADNGKAMDDINRLHQQLMYIKEEHANRITDLESKLQQAQEQVAKFEFLKAQYARKISALEKESQLKSEKILQLQTRSCGQAVIQITDRRKAPFPASQKMELSHLLPPQAVGTSTALSQNVPDQQELEVLRMADSRIHQLEQERRQLLSTIDQARLNTELLQKRIEVRDNEIERLANLLKGGRPEGVVLLENNLRKDVEDETDLLQERIAGLENRTLPKKVIESKTSSRVRKINLGHLQKGAEDAERKHRHMQRQKQLLDKANKELAHMEATGATSKKLEGQIRALKSEKEALLNQVRQLTNNEKDLLHEIDLLSRHQPSSSDGPSAGMSTATSHLLSMVRELEKERDQYKEEIMILHDLIKKGGTNGVDRFPLEDGGRMSVTSGSSLSSWNRGREQVDSLKKLALERDAYREKYYEKCKELEDHVCPKVLPPSNGYSTEAQSLLQKLEQRVLDLNERLSLATSERDRLARQLSETAARSDICPLVVETGSTRREIDGSQNYGEDIAAGTVGRRDELNREISLLEDKLKKSEQQFSAAKVTLASQRTLIETQRSEIQNLQQRLDDAAAKYDILLRQTTSSGALSERRESIQREFEVRKDQAQQTKVHDGRWRDEVEVQTEETALRNKDSQMKEAKAALNAMELRVSELQSDVQAKDHEIYKLRQQVERLQRELATANATIGEIRGDNQKLNSDLSVMAREHQHMAADLESAKRQTEELRRQIQEYVTEVARIEELLRYKDKEREELLEQYKNLTLANSELEAQTHDLESLHSSTQVQLQKRDIEMDHYQDMVHDLEAQLAQHVSRAADHDDQLNALRASMETLKGELEQKDCELRRLRQELLKNSEVQQRLNATIQELQERLSSEEVSRQRLASRAQELEDNLSLARNEAAAARSNTSTLEGLLAVARERECLTEANFQHLSSQLQSLQERLNSTSGHREAQMQENAYLRSKLVEFEREVEQLKRQVTNERYEREKTKEELRNLQQHASHGLRGHLTLHGFSGSLRTAVDFKSDAAGATSQNSHSYPYGAAPPDNHPST